MLELWVKAALIGCVPNEELDEESPEVLAARCGFVESLLPAGASIAALIPLRRFFSSIPTSLIVWYLSSASFSRHRPTILCNSGGAAGLRSLIRGAGS